MKDGLLSDKAAHLAPQEPHHSWRVVYCAQAYHDRGHQHGMIASMSRTGTCYDNAPIKSFWGILTNALVPHRRCETREQAQREITEYIESFYNRPQQHSRLGNRSPAAFAQQGTRQQPVACGGNSWRPLLTTEAR